jgi:uncharacterized Zn finger protein
MAAAFTEADPRRIADRRPFDRGLGYLDCVHDLDVSADEITATVYGNAEYQVTLMLDDDGVARARSCPYGVDGHWRAPHVRQHAAAGGGRAGAAGRVRGRR